MEVSAIKHTGVAGAHGRSPLLRLQSDERLVALVRRGNQHAFEALVARYQSRLLAFCRHMLGSREDAEDVLQEVFAAAFNAMLADDRPINVRPWLYRIARNRSLNHLRRVPAVGVDSMDTHFSDHGLSTAEKVHRREDFRLLITDVQDLPETQRTALLLREIDALSYEQIAEAMDNTVPSVKSLLVRARVGLAEAAEARHLDCDAVRFELGEAAEGLRRISSPVRRHLRTCERCASFKRQLATTNRALAALLPVGPLLVLKKMLLAHLGTTAAASGGAAAGGVAAGGALQVGISTAATKAAAGLAAAAIVTAGAVEVKHVAERPERPAAITASAPASPPSGRTASPATASPILPPDVNSGMPGGGTLAPPAIEDADRDERGDEAPAGGERGEEVATEDSDATGPALAAAVPTPVAEALAGLPVASAPTLLGAPTAGTAPVTLPLDTEAVVQPADAALGSPVTGVVMPGQSSPAPLPILQPALQPPGVHDDDGTSIQPVTPTQSGPPAPVAEPAGNDAPPPPTAPREPTGTGQSAAEQPAPAPAPDHAAEPEPAVEPDPVTEPDPQPETSAGPEPDPAGEPDATAEPGTPADPEEHGSADAA